jgi:hypothetical protein
MEMQMQNLEYVSEVVSEEIGVSYERVLKVNDAYWAYIKELMASGDYSSIFLTNLGTFSFIRYKINAVIIKYIISIRKLRKGEGSFARETPEQREVAEVRLISELRKLLERRNDVAVTYYDRKKRIVKKYG